jgi:hypothetical protein
MLYREISHIEKSSQTRPPEAHNFRSFFARAAAKCHSSSGSGVGSRTSPPTATPGFLAS